MIYKFIALLQSRAETASFILFNLWHHKVGLISSSVGQSFFDKQTFKSFKCTIDESIKGAASLRRYGITFDGNINIKYKISPVLFLICFSYPLQSVIFCLT